jgi:tryptophan halogenase
MKHKKVVIVGGGTAGWMTAAFLQKYYGKDNSIVLVESPSIPKIGVGESVTPDVAAFLNDLGISRHHWMKHTGAVYKYANKFIGWKTGYDESEYFSFNWTVPADNFYKDITPAQSTDDFLDNDPGQLRSTDYALKLCERNVFSRFDQCFNPQFHYMEKNVAPFEKDNIVFNGPASFSHHINAELASNYIKDFVAIPNGVTHIIGTIVDVSFDKSEISKITLDDGSTVTGDLFIDCSGFSRVLIKNLGWEEKVYEHHLIDRVWVTQTEYTDPENEMVNYTQSIAEPYGWRFKIGLYHRMGNGYCFSSKHISDEDALNHFIKQIGPQRFPPKLIKWKPSRLNTFAQGNVVAIGLTCGFVEPLEANALYTVITGIQRLGEVLSTASLNWESYNKKMAEVIDDIADFILVHYTLSSRQDTTFWKEMSNKGTALNHHKLVWDKYYDRKNSMHNTLNGHCMYPDLLWLQLARSWGIPNPKSVTLDPLTEQLAQLHFQSVEHKHRLISQSRQNNFHWLKENVFDNLSPSHWEDQFIKNR